MILFIDNYDSFTYNLVQLASVYQCEVKVVRNDELTIKEIREWDPSHIIISPGSGYPDDAGISVEVINQLWNEYVMLGVCLGHQAVCKAAGGNIVHAKTLFHGKQTEIIVQTKSHLFQGMPEKILAARYHSLVVQPETLPDKLEILARDAQGEVMAVQWKGSQTYGVQFHPESILTPLGNKLMQNFLNIKKGEFDYD